MPLLHGCDLSEQLGRAPWSTRDGGRRFDRDSGQVLRRENRIDVLHAEPLRGRVDEAASSRGVGFEKAEWRDPECVSGGRNDLIEGQPLSHQPLRIHQHLELLVPLTPDRDVGDTRDAHQLGADVPSGEDREFEQRDGAPPEPDHHHPTRRGLRLQQRRRFRNIRKRLRRFGEALLNNLPRVEWISAVLEDQLDRRQAGNRLRGDVLEERNTVEQVLLHGRGDQLFDLVGGETERFRADFYLDLAELGKHVDRHRVELHDAESEGEQRQGKYEAACADARGDQTARHWSSRVYFGTTSSGA